MTMAGGCANKNLVRIGGGNLKSVVVIIVMAIFAYMTLRGLIGLARIEIETFSNIDLTQLGLESQGLVDILALIFGFDVAFVAFHHLVRVLLIFVSMPIFITSISKSE